MAYNTLDKTQLTHRHDTNKSVEINLNRIERLPQK